MSFTDWLLSSVLTTAAIAVLAWLGRKWLAEWISASVRHDFDKKLEGLRAELRAKEAQIAALREGALANMIALQNATAQRRLKAADDLWQAVTELNAFTGALVHMSVIKFDAASARIETDPKLRKLFEMTSKIGPENFDVSATADSTRPYLSDLSWALFSAYRMIFHVAYMKMNLLKLGIDGRQFMKPDAINELLTKALPDHKDYIEKHGHTVHHLLVDPLRDRILAEIRKTIEGKRQDGENVQRAAEIVKLANAAEQEMDKQAARGSIESALKPEPATT